MNNRANQASPIRIVAVDDHALMREGVVSVLRRQSDLVVVGEGSNGPEAMTLCRQLRPSILLLDLYMPGGLEGPDIVASIVESCPTTRVIVLTTFETDDDILRSLRAGAKAYLLKDVPPEELVSCIRQVHRGQNWVSPVVGAKLAAQATQPAITARELDVLRLIAAGRSNKEIAVDLCVAEGTIKSYTNTLFAKLGARSRTEAVAVAVRRGLVRID